LRKNRLKKEKGQGDACKDTLEKVHDDEYQPSALTAFPDSAWTFRSHK
jgi:hypothetical protein